MVFLWLDVCCQLRIELAGLTAPRTQRRFVGAQLNGRSRRCCGTVMCRINQRKRHRSEIVSTVEVSRLARNVPVEIKAITLGNVPELGETR
jgi:hypothetical protein